MYKQNSLANIEERYKGSNLLLPVSTEIQLNPFYKYVVMEVTADISDGSGDIFNVGNTKVGSEKKINKVGEEYESAIYADVFSPAKPLLMKLASAAGIQFDPCHTGGGYVSKNCYKAKAYGALRMPDGTGKTHCDEKVINLDDEEDRLRLEFMDKSLEGITDDRAAKEAEKMFKGKWINATNKWHKPCKAFVVDDCDRQKYIDRGVLVNMTLLRKTFAEKAMTGAILRVVRALIGMKGTYSLAELKKPFAIPRVTFSPDYTDPMVRAAMLDQGLNSVSNMFGSTNIIPSNNTMSPILPPMTDSFNPEEFGDNAAFDSDYIEDPAEDFTAPILAEPPPMQSYQHPPSVATSNPSNNELVCVMCSAKISEPVHAYSMKKFKQPLCFNCQKEAL